MTERLLRGFPQTVQTTFYLDGTPTSAGTVTVTITRADGTAVATAAATTTPSTGVYVYSLAAQSLLGLLTATFTGTIAGSPASTTVQVEIVGGFYVSLAEIRALPNLSEVAKFTNAELADARTWFESTFERATGVAWVPRYARDRVAGGSVSTLILPHWPVRNDPLTGQPAVYSVRSYTDAATYAAFTAGELADLIVDGPHLRRFAGSTFTLGNGNLMVEYEHGYDSPPADVVEAAKVAIRDRLLGQNVGNRVFGVTTEQGILRTSTPGPGRPFGIPDVDEVAAANDHRVPAIA